jgi:ATP-dependent DNA helicase RecG
MRTVLDQLLTSETETELLEFKKAENQYDKNKLGQYFSALSNEANLMGKKEAWLIFGVNNSKQIVGTTISDKQLNEYKREISNNTSPTTGFINVQRVSTENGDVIMLKIPAAAKATPIAWKGHYYGRDGESLGALNKDEYDRICNQIQLQDWSAEILLDACIADLSEQAIAEAKKQYTLKNTHIKDTIANWDNLTFLNKAKVCVNGKITRTAILLLGKPESDHFINPSTAKITWILKDRDNLEKDYAHFYCPLILEVNHVYSKIRNLKYRYLLSGTLFPDEVEQFAPYIIREALNNCIAHQDYSLGSKIVVVEYEDGRLIFLGRYKDMLKVGGENVSPAEVEAHLMKIPGIQATSVVAYPDQRLHEVGVAFTILKTDIMLAPEEIIGFLKGKIASFKIPRHIIFVQEFPMTSSGKVQKAKLRKQAVDILG